ncbi:SRPBCC family protein [Paractinoplanes lichenicola]|uniref:Carbon monoxide dehydrogenase n=1 Tax=Paractinoplanes lichenicola TaxID=2802976 RepID=A0ABS1VUM5_9ACTN|nr:SRPBCC family protein [Actinoplanes lichenicola]MBL7258187.1 carbon monoxide dehydrogenase [Actinoplanes lichenicola]
MKITNEFTVHTPIERAWQVLTDLEGVAPCLPGAQLTGVDGDVYKGKVKVKVGPVISDFAGTAQFTEKDDSAYRAVIDAKGRDARAGGNASALVTASLTPAGESTLVSVDTDLKISGKLAQFGSGMIKEISNKLLAEFVTNLEAKLATDPATTDTVPGTAAVLTSGPPAATPSADAPSPETLTANLIPADPGAAEPATPAVGGSEPLAASTIDDKADAVAAPPATSTPPAPTTTSAAVDSSPSSDFPVNGAPSSSARAKPLPTATRPAPAPTEPEPLDLLAVAGGSLYKRAIPVAIGAVVVVGVIVWFVARR